MAFVAGQIVTAEDLNAIANVAGINSAAGSSTSTSTSYANLSSPSSFSFTKIRNDTRIRVNFHITAYVTVGNTAHRFAVNINGTDYDMVGVLVNTANEHAQYSGTRVINGISAGTYTVQGRLRRVSGTGTVTIDTNDWIAIMAAEI